MNVHWHVECLNAVLRGETWSSCIRSERKERKTTQQHGQIRLSETRFKIWVRVHNLSLSLSCCTHPPLHPISSLTVSFHPFCLPARFKYPQFYFIHPFCLLLSILSFVLLMCRAWHVLPERSTEAAASPSARVQFCRRHLQLTSYTV